MRYRRDRLTVHTDDGPSEAWVYIDHRVDPGCAAPRLSGAHHRRRRAPRPAAPVDRVPHRWDPRIGRAAGTSRVRLRHSRFRSCLTAPGILEDSTLRSRFGFLAIHGGGLEQMTDVIAERAAEAAGASVYVLRHPDHYPHHLPSALYRAEESERLAEFLDHVDVAVSLHGYGRIGRSTQLLAGGRNRTLAAHLAQHVVVPGYQVVTDLDAIPRELRGLHPDNPVNRVRGGGTQLELSPRVRGISPRSPLPVTTACPPRRPRWSRGSSRPLTPGNYARPSAQSNHCGGRSDLGFTATPASAEPPPSTTLTRSCRPTTSPAASPSSATARTSPATPPGSPTSTPAKRSPRRPMSASPASQNLCRGDYSAARRRGQGRPRRAHRDVLARPHSRRGHRRQCDHRASAAAASERPAGVLRRRNAAARRTGDRGSAPRRGAGADQPSSAGHRDEIHQHQLHRRRPADRSRHRTACRRGDHLANHLPLGLFETYFPAPDDTGLRAPFAHGYEVHGRPPHRRHRRSTPPPPAWPDRWFPPTGHSAFITAVLDGRVVPPAQLDEMMDSVPCPRPDGIQLRLGLTQHSPALRRHRVGPRRRHRGVSQPDGEII